MVVTRLSTKDIAVFKLEKVLVCASAYKKSLVNSKYWCILSLALTWSSSPRISLEGKTSSTPQVNGGID